MLRNRLGWFRPDAPGKTREGKKRAAHLRSYLEGSGSSYSDNQLVPKEFRDAVVADVGSSVTETN